jgi:hypothetical protein
LIDKDLKAVLLIIIAILVLAMIGLGVDTFFSGVLKGVQQLGSLPVVSNAAEKVKQYLHNATEDVKDKLIS